MKILKPYREEIDALDDQIVALLVKREAIIRSVGALKKKEGIDPVLQDRIDTVRERNARQAVSLGGSDHYTREIYKKIIQLSCDLEDDIKKDLNV